MVKKKFELEENVAKLAEKYIDTTEIDWNELVNKAIKYYISKKLLAKLKPCLKKMMMNLLNTLMNISKTTLIVTGTFKKTGKNPIFLFFIFTFII